MRVIVFFLVFFASIHGQRLQDATPVNIFTQMDDLGLTRTSHSVKDAIQSDIRAHLVGKYNPLKALFLLFSALGASSSEFSNVPVHNHGVHSSHLRIPDRRKRRLSMNADVNSSQESNYLLNWVGERLRTMLPIQHLEVIDVTDGHAMEAFLNGSNRALDPKGLELRLTVISSAFDGAKLIDRQRMVNKALELELLGGSIHALPRMKTLTLEQWQKTHEKHRQELDDARDSFGAENPRTLEVLDAYADALVALNCFVEAEPLRRAVLEISRRNPGSMYVDTLKALRSYADILESIGRRTEAEPLRKEICEITLSRFGSEHPETLKAADKYTDSVRSFGRDVQSIPL